MEREGMREIACQYNLHPGTTLSTDEQVAVKLEKRKTKHPQLHIEAKFLSMLHGGSKLLIEDRVNL